MRWKIGIIILLIGVSTLYAVVDTFLGTAITDATDIMGVTAKIQKLLGETVKSSSTSWIDPDAANIVAVFYMQEQQPNGVLVDGSTNVFDATAEALGMIWKGITNKYVLKNLSSVFLSTTNAGGFIGTSTNISVSGWANIPETSSLHSIGGISDMDNVAQGEITSFISSGNWKVRVRNDAGTTLSVSFTNINAWVHFVFNFDGVDMRLYLDGIIQATACNAGSIDANGAKLSVGAHKVSSQELQGNADKYHFFKRTLTSNEIFTASQLDREADYDIDAYTNTDLVAYYGFGSNVVGALDNSGNYIEASSRPTFANAPTFFEIVGTNSNSRVQYAVRGDGSDDRLSVVLTQQTNSPPLLDFGTNDMSAMAWINWDTTSGGRILGRGVNAGASGWMLDVTAAGVIRFIVDGTSQTIITNDTPISTGSWHHVAGVLDHGVEMSLWIDAVKQAETASPSPDMTGTEIFSIFASSDAGDFFDGLLEGVRIYDIAVTNISGSDGIYTNTLMPNGDIEARLSNP